MRRYSATTNRLNWILKPPYGWQIRRADTARLRPDARVVGRRRRNSAGASVGESMRVVAEHAGTKDGLSPGKLMMIVATP